MTSIYAERLTAFAKWGMKNIPKQNFYMGGYNSGSANVSRLIYRRRMKSAVQIYTQELKASNEASCGTTCCFMGSLGLWRPRRFKYTVRRGSLTISIIDSITKISDYHDIGEHYFGLNNVEYDSLFLTWKNKEEKSPRLVGLKILALVRRKNKEGSWPPNPKRNRTV